MKYIKIIDKLLDKKYWSKVKNEKYYSRHDHLGSPIETYDSCGNCSGARCEGCKLVVLPDYFECSVSCDILVPIVKQAIEEQYPDYTDNSQYIAEELVYCDGSYRPDTDLRISWPGDAQLKDQYKDFYAELQNNN